MSGQVTIGAFREVVFSVNNLESSVDFYEKVAGWAIVNRGVASANQATFWQLDPQVKIEYVLLKEAKSESGYLRLVKFHGVEQQVIRSSARTWDIGGIYDVNVRVHDIWTKFKMLRSLGWHGVTDPIEYSFSGLVVKEVLVRGHDDVVFALIERVHPPLQADNTFKEMSRVFNSSQIVADVGAEVDFYTTKLGFTLAFRGKIDFEKDQPNVLGLPYNLAETSPDVAILSPHADGSVNGSMEFLTIPNAKGMNFADRAIPPNLGILTLRYPVSDIDAYYARLLEHEVQIIAPPTEVEIAPYGIVKIMAIRTLNGTWLEFFEVTNG
ncbi:MAG: VOC family protein [Aggregatilineales bacterium]